MNPKTHIHDSNVLGNNFNNRCNQAHIRLAIIRIDRREQKLRQFTQTNSYFFLIHLFLPLRTPITKNLTYSTYQIQTTAPQLLPYLPSNMKWIWMLGTASQLRKWEPHITYLPLCITSQSWLGFPILPIRNTTEIRDQHYNYSYESMYYFSYYLLLQSLCIPSFNSVTFYDF